LSAFIPDDALIAAAGGRFSLSGFSLLLLAFLDQRIIAKHLPDDLFGLSLGFLVELAHGAPPVDEERPQAAMFPHLLARTHRDCRAARSLGRFPRCNNPVTEQDYAQDNRSGAAPQPGQTDQVNPRHGRFCRDQDRLAAFDKLLRLSDPARLERKLPGALIGAGAAKIMGSRKSPEGNIPSALSDEPSPLVDVEFHQALVAHFQKQRLASFLIGQIGALHDLIGLERLLAERIQDIFAIFQHDYFLQAKTLAFTVE